MIEQEKAPAEDRGCEHQETSKSISANGRGPEEASLALNQSVGERAKTDGAKLLDDLVALFTKHLSLPDGAAEVMALWVVFAHCFDAFDASPRLALVSPIHECGKTTSLTLLNGLVPRPFATSNVTPAVIYRAIDQAIKDGGCTVIIDEADTFMESRDPLVGILNSGHTRATAYVSRCVGDTYEPHKFSTWAPIVIAMIGSLPPALKSRSFVIAMRRAKPEEKIERVTRAVEAELELVRDRLTAWADLHRDELQVADPKLPVGLRGRLADNLRPLFAIADAAGAEWPERATAIAKRITGNIEPAESIKLLDDLRRIFTERRADKLSSATLCEGLKASSDERFWTQIGLAKALKPFGIFSRSVRIDTRSTPKGYQLKDFEDAFSRYLEPQEIGLDGITLAERHNATSESDQ